MYLERLLPFLAVVPSALALPAPHAVTQLERREHVNAGFACLPKQEGISSRASCYHEVRTAVVYGAPHKLTQDINCNVPKGCTSQATFTFTSEQSFSISIGANVDGDLGASKVLKAGASTGATWSWSKSTATGSAQGYDLNDGETGHVLFFPFMRESCGDLAITPMNCHAREACVPQLWNEHGGNQVNAINACGYTPKRIDASEDSQVDGIHRFCFIGGPRKGQGCETPDKSFLPGINLTLPSSADEFADPFYWVTHIPTVTG